MPLPQQKTDERFSYADYLTWPDDERWELIGGEPLAMSPAPTVRHQRLSRKLAWQFENYLHDKPCELFTAPFDVRLSEQPFASDDYIDTVVQPDMLVICDSSKLDERGCNGSPDLVIEILSPSSAAHDLKIKYDIYQRFGVKEYWIIYPAEHVLQIYKLGDDGCYGAAERYAGDDKVAVAMLGDLIVDLKEVFTE